MAFSKRAADENKQAFDYAKQIAPHRKEFYQDNDWKNRRDELADQMQAKFPGVPRERLITQLFRAIRTGK